MQVYIRSLVETYDTKTVDNTLMTSTSRHSKSPSAPPRLRVRQKRSVTRGNEAEQFIWDGLALVHRDGSDYLNEPSIGGGNPIASNGKVMLNDMLGSTVAVKGDEGYSTTSMTAFGESGDAGAFFTGKPFIGEIGYVFLMRSYRPENGKWQTADPLGYPDGWNSLAYCNNHATSSVDLYGCQLFIVNGTEGRLNRELYESNPEQFMLEMGLFVQAVNFVAQGESLPNFNVAGFSHWLNRTVPGDLPWESFDSTGSLAATMIAYFENEVSTYFRGRSYSSYSPGVYDLYTTRLDMLVNGSWGNQISHNRWINLYSANILLSSVTLTVEDGGSWYIDICANLWANDISDFNPGETFSFNGMTFYDDDFIWLMNTVLVDDGAGNPISRWGKDYAIRASKTIGMRITE